MDSKNGQILDQVVKKIGAAKNVLVALSSNPTVDEMAGAIGITMLIDALGKHATAIYSGQTPNALEFLKPGETFESNVNSLQDFIIALNKEKADHIRYKVDGDFVKVYITPYRTALSEEDLEFSHGEFNVDLIIALNVKSADEFDNVLREHGRILHDAGSINISVGTPGKISEVEWADPSASSVCEMIANFAMQLKDMSLISKEIATALLTGIVAETGRFSNAKTTPKTMTLASRLMAAGADQQLIAANIKSEEVTASEVKNEAQPEVSIREANDGEGAGMSVAEMQEEAKTPVEVPEVEAPAGMSVAEMPEVKIEESLENAEETSAPETVETEVKEPEPVVEVPEVAEEASAPEMAEVPVVEAAGETELPKVEEVSLPEAEAPKTEAAVEMLDVEPVASENIEEPKFDASVLNQPEVAEETTAPEMNEVQGDGETRDYSKMISDALSESGGDEISTNKYMGNPLGENPAAAMAPDLGQSATANDVPEMSFGKMPEAEGEASLSLQDDSYIVSKPPKVLSPDAAGETVVEPTETKLPMPEDGILPPPPTPPIDFGQMMPDVQMPEETKVEKAKPVEVPEVPESVRLEIPEAPKPETNTASESGAFRIPGM